MSLFFEFQIERLQAKPEVIVKKTKGGYEITSGLKTANILLGEDEKLYDFMQEISWEKHLGH